MLRNLMSVIVGSFTTYGVGIITVPEDLPPGLSLEELIRYLISIVGGILATIILAFLKKHFPEWFGKLKKSEKRKWPEIN